MEYSSSDSSRAGVSRILTSVSTKYDFTTMTRFPATLNAADSLEKQRLLKLCIGLWFRFINAVVRDINKTWTEEKIDTA